MSRPPVPFDQRFWPKIDKNGPVPAQAPHLGPCWMWLAARDRFGYGCTSLGRGRSRRAHRVIYEWLVGPIPDGLTLDHLCRNKSCVNPSHLEPVTMAENNRRSNNFAGVNSRKTHCPKGHDYATNTIRRSNGKRECKACALDRYYAAKERRAS